MENNMIKRSLLSLFVVYVLFIGASCCLAQSFPALDITGQRYSVSEVTVGGSLYTLTVSYTKGIMAGGFQDFDWLTFELFKDRNFNNPLFPNSGSSLGRKVQMPLDSIPSSPHPETFQERWDSLVSRLSNVIKALNITGAPAIETDPEKGWRYAHEKLFLDTSNGLELGVH